MPGIIKIIIKIKRVAKIVGIVLLHQFSKDVMYLILSNTAW